MGKKSQTVLTNKESLRLASNRLERHIFHSNSQYYQSLFKSPVKMGLSYHTADTGTNLILATKEEAEILQDPQGKEVDDLEDLRHQIKRKKGLTDHFQDQLDLSMTSYQRTYQIFKKLPLKQRYRHLLFPSELGTGQEESKSNCPQLQTQESATLQKLKRLYHRYRVSNMYKKDVVSKISKKNVEKLIRKGYLRQNKGILSLTC